MAAVGRGRSFGPRMAPVGAWSVPCAPYGRRGGVAGPLRPVWPPCGRGRSPGPRMAAVGRSRFPGPRMAAVGAWPFPAPCMAAVGVWPVLWALYGRRGGVAGPLGPVWPP